LPFATGFFLIAPQYRNPEVIAKIREELAKAGFETYEMDNPAYLLFYVEAPTVDDLVDVIRYAEGIEGVLKAYIAYGFLADKEAEERLNQLLENKEIGVSEEAKAYFRLVLSRIEEQGSK